MPPYHDAWRSVFFFVFLQKNVLFDVGFPYRFEINVDCLSIPATHMIFSIDKKGKWKLDKILYLQQKILYCQRMELSPPLAKQKYVWKKINWKIERKKIHAILYWQSMELNPPLAKQNIWFSFRYKHASLQLESFTKLWSWKVPDQCFILSCFQTW